MADLAKIEATIARLEDQLRQARERKLKIEHFIEMMDAYARDGDEPDRSGGNGRRTTTSSRIRELAYDLIASRRQPTPLPDIVGHIAASGLEIETKDKASYVSSILSRDDRLKNIRGTGWIISGITPKTPESQTELQTGEIGEAEIKEETAGAEENEPEAKPPSRPMFRPRRQSPIAEELDEDVPF